MSNFKTQIQKWLMVLLKKRSFAVSVLQINLELAFFVNTHVYLKFKIKIILYLFDIPTP